MVRASDRFRIPERPCPICGGGENLPKGESRRCWGYIHDNRAFVTCTRIESTREVRPGEWKHSLAGPCNCSHPHEAIPASPSVEGFTASKAVSSQHQFTTLVAQYPAHDARTGAVVAYHGRFECTCAQCQRSQKPEKRFRWRLADDQKWNGLRNRYRTADFALYGASRLGDERIVVVEGEKACDSLLVRGVQAVGTVTGAGSVPSDDALQPLVNHEIILWPDSDDAGRKHMTRMAEALDRLGAASIRVVDWPDAPQSGDAADFNGSAKDLVELLDSADVWDRPEAESAPVKPLAIRCLADVEPEEVSWLAEPYIPLGKLTLVEGDPGVGKSHVLLSLAAAVSRGHGFPGMASRDAANVLLLSAEDGLADTVRPRLDRMGADMRRVYAVDEPVTLDAEGMVRVEAAIRMYQPAVVVIDPLVAYLGGKVDMHRANEVREVLAHLASLAERYGCAIVGCRHLTKSPAGQSIYRGLGSIDFTAASRSVLLVGKDPEDDSLRAMVQIKNNLAAFGSAQGFTIEEGVFRWTGPSALTDEQLLASQTNTEPTALAEAKQLLLELLGESPRPATDVQRLASEAGITRRTLERAKQALGVVSERVGQQGKQGGGQWCWALPDKDVQVTKCFDRQSQGVAILSSDGDLNPTAYNEPTTDRSDFDIKEILRLARFHRMELRVNDDKNLEYRAERTVPPDLLYALTEHAAAIVDAFEHSCPQCGMPIEDFACYRCEEGYCRDCGEQTGSIFRSRCFAHLPKNEVGLPV